MHNEHEDPPTEDPRTDLCKWAQALSDTDLDGTPGTTVRRSAVLPADPDRVWEALTHDVELSAWLGGAAHLDPRPDGAGSFVGPDGRRQVRVRRAEPSRRLTWRWWPHDDDGEGASEVDLVLVPIPGGTRIDVTETPVAATASVEWALRLETLARVGVVLVG